MASQTVPLRGQGLLRRRVHAGIRAVAIAACTIGAAALPAVQATPPEAAAVAEFQKRVDAYVALHRKLEAKVPRVPDDATPEQIDQTQRALEAAIRAARTDAKRGDLFTPEMTAHVKDLIARVLKGTGGVRLRSSLMDENVKELPLQVNQRFPTEIPLATMPPTLLKALPELPEDLEFRFVASQFVLLDTHAQLVVDLIPGALPPRAVP